MAVELVWISGWSIHLGRDWAGFFFLPSFLPSSSSSSFRLCVSFSFLFFSYFEAGREVEKEGEREGGREMFECLFDWIRFSDVWVIGFVGAREIALDALSFISIIILVYEDIIIEIGWDVVPYLAYLLEFFGNFTTRFQGPNQRLKSGQIPGRGYIKESFFKFNYLNHLWIFDD